MKRIYCFRCKKQSWAEEGYSAVLFDDSHEVLFDEAIIESFNLCESCKNEFINVFMNKTVEEPHKILDERVLLTEATREDVREYMEECGVNEDYALFISERVRKGLVHSSGWREDMLEEMAKTTVPEWFLEGCKNIIYLSRRDNYRPPYLADESIYQTFFPVEDVHKRRDKVNLLGVTILSEEDLEKNTDLIRIRKPFWVRLSASADKTGKCGVVMGPYAMGPYANELRVYCREWGAVYPVILLKENKIESGSKLIYAGEEFTVLQGNIALCKSGFMFMKEPMITARCFDETPMMQMLDRWFETNGEVAEVVID